MTKKQGHYCKVCGFYKSNESFSGRGHSAHICKKCAALSPAERSIETTMMKMLNLPWRLSKEQLSWLKSLRNDKRLEIAEMAKEVYESRFPFAERNERKKQLRIQEMNLTIHDELMDEYGDCFNADISFSLSRKQRTILYGHDGATDTLELWEKEMKTLLNRIVDEFEVFCWEEDYSCEAADSDLWEDENIDLEAADEDSESTSAEVCEPPSWAVSVTYSNGEMQTMKGNYIPELINDLVLELLEYFEDTEELDEDE